MTGEYRPRTLRRLRYRARARRLDRRREQPGAGSRFTCFLRMASRSAARHLRGADPHRRRRSGAVLIEAGLSAHGFITEPYRPDRGAGGAARRRRRRRRDRPQHAWDAASICAAGGEPARRAGARHHVLEPETVVGAIRAGATTSSKSVELDALVVALERAVQHRRLRDEKWPVAGGGRGVRLREPRDQPGHDARHDLLSRVADSEALVWSPARAAPARSWWPACSTGAGARTDRSFPSTAPRCRRRCWRASCSDMPAAPSPTRAACARASSCRRTAARSSSTRSASCRSRCSRSCCARCRNGWCGPSVPIARSGRPAGGGD